MSEGMQTDSSSDIVADCMYLFHEGEFRAHVVREGGPVVGPNTLRAGELFGELMLSGEPRAASLQVDYPGAPDSLTRAAAERVLAQRPELAFQLIAPAAAEVLSAPSNRAGATSVQQHQVPMILCCLDLFDGQRHGTLPARTPDDVDRPPAQAFDQAWPDRNVLHSPGA